MIYAWLAVVSTTIAVFILVFSGCASAKPELAGYAAEQTACVELAKSRTEADECRAKVKAKYGRLDGGVE